jgi:hypothetical protein
MVELQRLQSPEYRGALSEIVTEANRTPEASPKPVPFRS